MKVSIDTQTKKEIEITTPHFRKFSLAYFKINEGEVIKVNAYPFSKGIERSVSNLGAAFMEDSVEITEQEFNEAYAKMKEEVNQWN